MIKEGACASRGAYKVDLRLVFMSTNSGRIQYHDVANCEFAKDGDLQRKIVTDNAKLIGEAKTILDHLVRTCKLSHKEARRLSIVNLRTCGKYLSCVTFLLMGEPCA